MLKPKCTRSHWESLQRAPLDGFQGPSSKGWGAREDIGEGRGEEKEADRGPTCKAWDGKGTKRGNEGREMKGSGGRAREERGMPSQ